MAFPPDFTVLIDTPMGSAGALAVTLDALERDRAIGSEARVLVLTRGEDVNAIGVASRHRLEPLLMLLPASGPVDPAGQIAAALVGRYTMVLSAGVTVDPVSLPLRSMRDALEMQPSCAAVSGLVVGVDDRFEANPCAAALHGGAVMLRNEALLCVGGFSRVMDPGHAADFDLTCRLLRGRYTVEHLDELRFPRIVGRTEPAVFEPGGLRDELITIERFLPRAMRRRYRRDAIAKARAMTRSLGMTHELAKAVDEARRWAHWERRRGRSELAGRSIERIWGWGRTKRDVSSWASSNPVKRVALAGWSFNLYAAYRSARRAGLEVVVVADEDPMLRDATYRGVAVRPVREALAMCIDGVIVADESPVTAEALVEQIGNCFAGPVLTPWLEEESGLPASGVPMQPAHAA